jgi:hypothetical protein
MRIDVLILGIFFGFIPPALRAGTVITPDPAALREVAPGILEYHGVRLDKANHRITFPGTLNQREGLIEYLLVNGKGKVHESLLATSVQPHDIHLAMLLIGLKDGTGANAGAIVPPSAIDSDYLHSAPKLQGASVQLSVAWTLAGKRTEVPAENLILNLQTGHPMTSGSWTYNGSLVQDGVFLADEESSIVAVITDPTALVNNPRPGYDNDEIWQVRTDQVPPRDTPVEISITLTEPAAGAKP